MDGSNSTARIAEIRNTRSKAKGRIIRARESVFRLQDNIRRDEQTVRLAERELEAMGAKVRR